MTLWLLLVPVVLGWMLQLWLTARQTTAWTRELRRIRPLGVTAVGKAGRRYRGGIAYVALAVADKRVTGAFVLRGFTTFARPTPLPALVGLRLGVVAGERPLEGLADLERAAARDAAGMVRAAPTTELGATSTAGPQAGPSTVGAARPA